MLNCSEPLKTAAEKQKFPLIYLTIGHNTP